VVVAAEAHCMAAAIVDVVGIDVLIGAGISPQELGDADNLAELDVDLANDAASRLAASFHECDLADGLDDALVRGFASDTGAELPPDAAVCLYDNLDEGAVTDAVARRFVDGSDEHVREPLVSAVGACPSVMTAVLLAEIPADLPPSVQMCIGGFVEGHADLVARSLTSDAPDAGRELGAPLLAACPELTAALGG
jgi:hypothetical protein